MKSNTSDHRDTSLSSEATKAATRARNKVHSLPINPDDEQKDHLEKFPEVGTQGMAKSKSPNPAKK